MRHTSAAILAILAITLTVFFAVGGSQVGLMQPTLTGNVIDEDVPAVVTRDVEIILAEGFIPPGAALTLENGAITFETGNADVITLRLLGAEAQAYRIQRAPNPDAFIPDGGTELPRGVAADGSVYGVASYPVLYGLRSAVGSGWYVITAEYAGGVASVPVFLQ